MPSRTTSWALRILLRSPLHALVSRRLMLLTVIGRSTGRRYTFPVGYAIDGRSVTVVAASADRKTWWLNVVHASPVVMRIHGRDRNGIARVVWEADEADRALVGYAKAFPLSVPHRRETALGSAPDAGAVAVATAPGELRDAVIVRIALTAEL